MALNRKQNEAIAIMLELPDMPYTLVAERIGVHVATLWRWRNENVEFMETYENAVNHKWNEAIDMCVDRMVSMARGGDFKAVKYILDGSRFAPVEKKQINANIDTVIKIDYIDE